MRICEIRRFLGNFVVFVNKEKDIALLSSHERFHLHAKYKDKDKDTVIGCEFYFGYDDRTLKEAKKYVERILHEKEHRQTETII